MKIAIGCDHVGFALKQEIITFLEQRNIEVQDFGTNSDARTDYPIYGEKVAKAVAKGDCDRGIVICGTGVGIGIAANKVKGIRAVTCSEPYSALLSRQHNDTNVLSLGARVVGRDLALMIVDAWLSGEYEGGRHAKRVEMLKNLER